MSYLSLARAVCWELFGPRTPPSPAERTKTESTGYERNELNEDSPDALRVAITASPDLRLLLGLDPPPPPATTCRYCGQGASAGAPLLTYLDGHADHGGFCPPKRKPKHS